MPAHTLDEIATRLGAHPPSRVVAEGLMRKAAVACVLRAGAGDALEVLLIRRAEHPTDPWSGHMAFPGGRVDGRDADALAAALRETREEIGLDLAGAGRYLGELSHVIAMAHGKPLPLVIVPFVFRLAGAGDYVLNHEVQEVVWVPLDFLLDPANRSELDWKRAGCTLRLPCCRYEGRVIWGLTLKMIDELLSLLR